MRAPAAERAPSPVPLPPNLHPSPPLPCSCMSPACYEWQYGGDALEEGEDDSMRGPRYRTCVLREIREARAAAAGLPPQPLRSAGYRRRPA